MTTATTDAGGVGPGRGGRMSRPRKRDAVLRLLRGEDLETVSRSLGVTAANAEWLARSFPGRRRGEPLDPARGRRGAGERAAEGAPGRDAARAGVARSQDHPARGASRPFGPT